MRMYLSPAEVNESPLGLGLASSLSRLNAGVLDKMIARASMRCDSFTEKRLQAPGSTTLSQSANAGDTTLSVNSTLTLDSLAEQAAIIDTGGFQETQEIQVGGVTVAPAPLGSIAPYPGTLTLKAPLQYGHLSGTPLQFCYKEVTEAGTASSSDPYSEALQSQAAQLALAHMPALHVGLTRIFFTKSYPIQTIYAVEHAYSFDVDYNTIFSSDNPAYTGNIIVDSTSGYVRLKIGTVVTPQGFLRTTYTGGFTAIPEDIKIATLLYLTQDLEQMINPYRLKEMKQGKLSRSWDTKYTNVDEAERILKKYKRTV